MKENKNKYAGLTLEELEKKEKTMKGVVYGTGILILIASAVLFYFSIKNKKPAFSAVSISCMSTIIPAVIGLSQISAEIKSRKSEPK